MIALLLRLYPSAWRRRYGEEFAALLAERTLSPFDVADVVLGALDAHLRVRDQRAAHVLWKGTLMSLRIGGIAAIAAGSLWLLSPLFSAAAGGDPVPGMLSFLGGTVALVVALVGLSSFQARMHPRLVWAAFTIPAIGCGVSIVGMAGMGLLGDRPVVGDLHPWHVWFIGVITAVVGTVLFAIATWRAHALSRLATGLLGVGSGVLAIMIVAGLAGWLGEPGNQLVLPAIVAFALGWIALGIDAVGVDRRSRIVTLTL